jgi:hypothetical protein
MTTAKREISLSEVLGSYLCYTPSSTETHEFFADLRTMNHTLLRDSIQECQQAKKEEGAPAGLPKRHLIHMVYTRKVKELASLYPFLFATENALRAIAHEAYHNNFKDAFWWREVLNAADHGKNAGHYPTKGDGKKRIQKQPVNPSFLTECFYGVSQLSQRQKKKLQDVNCPSTQFYDELTIRHLFNLILSDLSVCPVGNLKKEQFKTHMTTICDARNEVFHGRPIKNRSSLYGACEIILDAACFHMGDFDEALRTTTYTRLTPSRKRNPKHLLPPQAVGLGAPA